MINVNNKSNKPLYEQIVDNIKEEVVKGILKENDPIPSVRKLALTIEVNPNTISKAYKELERQNIIETIQGKGTFIAKQNKEIINANALQESESKIKTSLVELKYLNMTDEDILKLIKKLLQSLKNI